MRASNPLWVRSVAMISVSGVVVMNCCLLLAPFLVLVSSVVPLRLEFRVGCVLCRKCARCEVNLRGKFHPHYKDSGKSPGGAFVAGYALGREIGVCGGRVLFVTLGTR